MAAGWISEIQILNRACRMAVFCQIPTVEHALHPRGSGQPEQARAPEIRWGAWCSSVMHIALLGQQTATRRTKHAEPHVSPAERPRPSP